MVGCRGRSRIQHLCQFEFIELHDNGGRIRRRKPCGHLRAPRVAAGFIEIVGADEKHDAAGIERDDVLLQANEHAARGVTADAAVGGLEFGESPVEVVVPDMPKDWQSDGLGGYMCEACYKAWVASEFSMDLT